MARKYRPNLFSENGIIGTKSFSGGHSGYMQPNVEPLNLLKGNKKYKWYKEMLLNDPFIGANYKLTTILGSKGEWTVKSGGESKKDQKATELVRQALFQDMEHSFNEFVKHMIGSMFGYGFGVAEKVYKRRKDGLFTLKKLSKRIASTVKEWDIPEADIKGIIQENPNNYKEYYIPYDKAIHCVVDDIDGSPEGVALIRNCFTSYHSKKYIQEQERVRVWKDARGILRMKVPSSILASTASKHVDFVNNIKQGLANVSNSHDSYILQPSDAGFDCDTLRIDGNVTGDTSVLIKRYDEYIATALLSSFILLAQKGGASGNLGQAFIKIYSSFIGSLMDIIKDQINRNLIPELLEINNIKVEKLPQLHHTNLNQLEGMLAALFIQSAGATGLITPTVERDNFLGKTLISPDFPEVSKEDFNKHKENNDFQDNTYQDAQEQKEQTEEGTK